MENEEIYNMPFHSLLRPTSKVDKFLYKQKQISSTKKLLYNLNCIKPYQNKEDPYFILINQNYKIYIRPYDYTKQDYANSEILPSILSTNKYRYKLAIKKPSRLWKRSYLFYLTIENENCKNNVRTVMNNCVRTKEILTIYEKFDCIKIYELIFDVNANVWKDMLFKLNIVLKENVFNVIFKSAPFKLSTNLQKTEIDFWNNL